MTTVTRPQICRVCHHGCAVLVDVEDGRAVRVRGDAENPVYHGYVCPKGRALPQMHNDPDRILHAHRRSAGGEFERIPLDDAIAEIAARLGDIVEAHGPRSVVAYAATAVQAQPLMFSAIISFLDAIGSPWPPLSAVTIDQAGKGVAADLHGSWLAPKQRFDEPEVGLLFGLNPLVSHLGFASSSPLDWLRARKAAGMKLIVVDPRRTETAHHADIHLQPKPGEDVALLAGMLHVILAEGLEDPEFVAANTSGVEALRVAVAPFTPDVVARRADVDREALVEAARTFGRARRGFVGAGTGPNMSGYATLVEYLVLCLDTVCGHWLREGEVVRAAPALIRRRDYKAQAVSPRPPRHQGPELRVPARTREPAPLQLMDAVDEMLLEGEGRIRAMLCVGGNPIAAWPDQERAIAALRALDLLVVVDPFVTATAKLADYLIPPKLVLEAPAYTNLQDFIGDLACQGYADSHAQYAPAAVEPPLGSDALEEWEFLARVATRMGRTMSIGRTELDGTALPTSDELLAALVRSARVPLAEVKRHPHGALFVDESVTVGPPDPDADGRLELGSPPMMEQLAIHALADPAGRDDPERPFRLISRRLLHVQNSMMRDYSATRPSYNPAFLHPDDMTELGVGEGDVVEIESRRGQVLGIVEADPALRRGLVSMSHCYGDLPEIEATDVLLGGNTARLVDVDADHDPFSGQARMSDIPVRIRSRAAAG
jgi:anaerobic selenocysteine-containing dehydrogenase